MSRGARWGPLNKASAEVNLFSVALLDFRFICYMGVGHLLPERPLGGHKIGRFFFVILFLGLGLFWCFFGVFWYF